MNGKEMYSLYVAANEEQNIVVDAWDDLSDEDHTVWDRTAELAMSRNFRALT